MRFNRTVFFNDYKGRFGAISNQKIVDGLNTLLDEIAADTGFTMIREVAYVLATIKGETGIFQPIQEKRASQVNQPKLWATQNKYWNKGFFGRGYVQLTWEDNYAKAGKKLTGLTMAKDDGTEVVINANTFVNNPDLVMQHQAAYLILSRGMQQGWFTGKKLSDYIKQGQTPDYLGAGKIINGTEQKEKFADFANKFELILRASLIA
jgi:putative chitinase